MDFIKGEILLINKPYAWTSFDVVNKIRRNIKHALQVKNIKIGHAGTLDPLATGLLILCTGAFTKRIEEIQSGNKEYVATFCLGKTTPSFDLETNVDNEFPIDHITAELINETAASFLGEQLQLPPVFSAKQIDGKRAYEFARRGEEVKLQPKKIHITQFEVLKIELPFVEAKIECSRGTYIRTIAHDFGLKLSSGAYLHSLCRTASGEYKLEDALSVEQMCYLIDQVSAKD